MHSACRQVRRFLCSGCTVFSNLVFLCGWVQKFWERSSLLHSFCEVRNFHQLVVFLFFISWSIFHVRRSIIELQEAQKLTEMLLFKYVGYSCVLDQLHHHTGTWLSSGNVESKTDKCCLATIISVPQLHLLSQYHLFVFTGRVVPN